MTASFPALPSSLLRAALALAVLAGLLLGLAHPPASPQIVASAAQTAVLELGGGTFGPSGHVLAEDFRQPQHRLAESTAPTQPKGGGKPLLLPAASPALRASAAARPSAAIPHPPAVQQPDRHRPTGPPRLPS